jgi:hypothetical protein
MFNQVAIGLQEVPSINVLPVVAGTWSKLRGVFWREARNA